MPTKECLDCKIVKPLSDYSIKRDYRGGRVYLYHSSYCKPCMVKRVGESHKNHQDAYNARVRAWRARNKDKVSANNKRYEAKRKKIAGRRKEND